MMKLEDMSDTEIFNFSGPIVRDIIKGSNQKDWLLFSKHFDPALIDSKFKADIERQWEEDEFLTSLSESYEFFGVVHKRACVLVVWRQRNIKNDIQALGKLYLKEIEEQIVQVGIYYE